MGVMLHYFHTECFLCKCAVFEQDDGFCQGIGYARQMRGRINIADEAFRRFDTVFYAVEAGGD